MRKYLGVIGVGLSLSLGLAACGQSTTTQTTAVTTETSQSVEAVESTEVTETATDNEEVAGDNIATTTAGQIRGVNNNGIFRFLGVPYAEAKERFVRAEAVTPWDGVRDALEYGAMSPQEVRSSEDGRDLQAGTSNNAQNLNIWTPALDNGKRPVMVWFHGGGFSTGTANEEMTKGENLSRSGDVVVVSVNHRLSAFGHLNLTQYGEKYKDSANVGIWDLVDALKWVQDNIENFGGDPNNVTLFGESGGGAKVLALMTSPEGKGLFQRGIVESGATERMGVSFTSTEASLTLTENMGQSLFSWD